MILGQSHDWPFLLIVGIGIGIDIDFDHLLLIIYY